MALALWLRASSRSNFIADILVGEHGDAYLFAGGQGVVADSSNDPREYSEWHQHNINRFSARGLTALDSSVKDDDIVDEEYCGRTLRR